MKKKHKIPLPLKFIRWAFPKLESLSPALAAAWFQHLFFTPFRYKAPEKELEAIATAETYQLNTATNTIYVYAWGAGPSVIMVHGWAGRGTQFRKFIEPFNEAGYRVVCLDGPAHGKSSGRKTDIREFADAIKAVYEHEKGIAIIAHSFGGVSALFAMAEGLSNKVLINIASPSIGEKIIQAYLIALGASARIGLRFREYIQKKTGKTFEDFSALRIIRRISPDTHLLLVHDKDDAEVTIDHPRELQKVFPQALLFETTDLGHNRILKDEKVINRCVTFVQQKASFNHQ